MSNENIEEQVQFYMQQLTGPDDFIGLINKNISRYDDKLIDRAELLTQILWIYNAQMRLHNKELLKSLFGDKTECQKS